MKTDSVPGQISLLYRHLRPALEPPAGNLAKAIESNAKHQAELLRTSSTVVRAALQGGRLKLASAVYELATGRVNLT